MQKNLNEIENDPYITQQFQKHELVSSHQTKKKKTQSVQHIDLIYRLATLKPQHFFF